MAELKNIHLLTDKSEKDLKLLEHAALQHRRHASVRFKILRYEDKEVTIRVTQEKSSAGKYFNQKRLIEIVHETFDRFFPGKKIHVHSVPFAASPADGVTATWVNKQMDENGIKLKDIVADTGIDKTQLSALINGDRPLSQPMKALFWFYFSSKKAV